MFNYTKLNKNQHCATLAVASLYCEHLNDPLAKADGYFSCLGGVANTYWKDIKASSNK